MDKLMAITLTEKGIKLDVDCFSKEEELVVGFFMCDSGIVEDINNQGGIINYIMCKIEKDRQDMLYGIALELINISGRLKTND